MKCIVKLCPHDDKDVTFTGPICYPCGMALKGKAHLYQPLAAKRIMATLVLEGAEVP